MRTLAIILTFIFVSTITAFFSGKCSQRGVECVQKQG